MADNEQVGALNDYNYVIQNPVHGREITMRLEKDTNNCVISIHAIREWCKRAGIAYSDFMRLLEEQFIVVTKRTRRDLGKYTVYRGSGSVECIVVNIPQNLLFPDEVGST